MTFFRKVFYLCEKQKMAHFKVEVRERKEVFSGVFFLQKKDDYTLSKLPVSSKDSVLFSAFLFFALG